MNRFQLLVMPIEDVHKTAEYFYNMLNDGTTDDIGYTIDGRFVAQKTYFEYSTFCNILSEDPNNSNRVCPSSLIVGRIQENGQVPYFQYGIMHQENANEKENIFPYRYIETLKEAEKATASYSFAPAAKKIVEYFMEPLYPAIPPLFPSRYYRAGSHVTSAEHLHKYAVEALEKYRAELYESCIEKLQQLITMTNKEVVDKAEDLKLQIAQDTLNHAI